MANLSPAVITREYLNDLIVEQAGSSTGATVGLFEWGPAGSVQLVNNNTTLNNVFGLPSDAQYVDHMVASNFLSYTNRLYVTRVVPDTDNAADSSAMNGGLAVSAASGFIEADTSGYATNETLIKNEEDFDSLRTSLSINLADVLFFARYAGKYGNKISVSMVSSANFATWDYNDAFDSSLENDEYAVVVTLNGEIAETYIGTNNPNSTSGTGGSDFIVEKINRVSNLIYMNKIDSLFADVNNFVSANIPITNLSGGNDGSWGTAEDAGRIQGWELYEDKENIEIDLPFVGGASLTASEWVAENIAAHRQDCLAFISPSFDDVVGITNISNIVGNIINRRNQYNSNSYVAMDGNYKYQYDGYNDTYRWVPLNGDIAGLHAKTDQDRDPWWAAAGFNRGHIKNVNKLAFNPKKAYRDQLYQANINPVATFPGDGVVLFGNKTLLKSTSSLSRINVRRLFNVLKRSIAKMARLQLFEFNDRQTRNAFLQAVEPFLRNVKARRGVQDYRAICDESNNTPQVIDTFQFVGDIYIKPAKAIETIFLNFIATRTGVDFEEVILNSEDR